MAYTIKQGETLGGIASSQGTTVQALQQANPNITDPNKIFAGGSLNIPGTTATSGVKTTSGQPIDASKLGSTTNNFVPPPVNTTTNANNLAATVGSFVQGSAANQVNWQNVPIGWDAQTYANFKSANPSLEPTAEDTQRMQQAKAPAAPVNQRQGILDKISNLLGVQATQGEVSKDIYASEGVFEKKQALTKLEGEAMAKERAYTKQAEKIRQNAEGKLEQGVNIDLANLDRQKNSELADIAIQAKIAQGAYTDANQIAEAKVKMQFEPLENQIKTLQNLYQLYGDDLTASEKMQAEAKIREKEGALDFARQKSLLYIKAGIDAAQKKSEGEALGLSGTATQFTAANYANRVEQSNLIIGNLSPTLKSMPQVKFKASLLAPSYLQSPEIQQYSQAAKNYVNAVLRRESGAAISPAEFNTAISQYLPAPGDSAEVLKQKEQNRNLVQRNFISEAGTAYQPLTADLMSTPGQTGTNPFQQSLGAGYKFKFYTPETGFKLPE